MLTMLTIRFGAKALSSAFLFGRPRGDAFRQGLEFPPSLEGDDCDDFSSPRL